SHLMPGIDRDASRSRAKDWGVAACTVTMPATNAITDNKILAVRETLQRHRVWIANESSCIGVSGNVNKAAPGDLPGPRTDPVENRCRTLPSRINGSHNGMDFLSDSV